MCVIRSTPKSWAAGLCSFRKLSDWRDLRAPVPRPAEISILIVNDNPEALLALEAALMPLELHVLKASTAEEGIANARASELAVALVDIRLPGIDGLAMVERLRADPATRALPVIFVSAVESTASTRERVYALGAVDFVALPAETAELRAKVRALGELHRERRELAERASAATRAADRAQREQRERLQLFMEAASDYAIFFTDPEGRISEWPASAENMFGFTTSEAVGQHLSLIFTPDDRARGAPERELAEASRHGLARDERWHQRKSGAIFFAAGRLVALREHDRIRGFAKVVRDATLAKQAEAELHEALDRFEALADSMAQMAWMSDPSGSRLWVNRRWREFTGTGVEEMRGWHFAEVFRPEERDQIVNTIRRHSAAGEQWQESWPIRSKDGTYRWFLVQAAPIRDPNGRVTRWFGTNTDIHEHVLVQQQLRASEQKFREIFETAHEGIWILDADARVELVNNRMAEILGYETGEIAGRRKTDFVFPEDVAEIGQLFERRRQGRADVVEVRFRRKTGEPVWTLLSGRPLFRDGKFAGVLDMFTDISARKEAAKRFEEKLKAQVAQRTSALQEKSRQLESFAYTIAHDLRSPLRAISGYAEFTLDDFAADLPAEAVENLRKIQTSAARLDGLIRDLLSYARVSQVEFVEQDVPLDTSIAWALEQLRTEIQARSARIDVDPALPCVRGERTIVDQLVLNLLSNAVKFVSPGVVPQVAVFTDTTDSTVRLNVRDNGIGIPPEYHERIFRVFERLKSEHRVPGTGVGLAIVARAAERLGGRAGVESEPGRGSTFWVEFKRCTS